MVQVASVDTLELKTYGKPMFLRASTGGAPSTSVVPDNWDEEKMGVWTGVPMAPSSFYTDLVNKKVYFAPQCTNSTNDWILLN